MTSTRRTSVDHGAQPVHVLEGHRLTLVDVLRTTKAASIISGRKAVHEASSHSLRRQLAVAPTAVRTLKPDGEAGSRTSDLRTFTEPVACDALAAVTHRSR